MSQQDYLLIDLVQKYGHLYNKKMPLYKDKLAKQNAWESIGNILNETADFCEQRWTILRNRYCTEKRKYIPSGSGSDATKQTWRLFNEMKFLDEFILPRRTHSSLTKVSNVTKPASSSCQAEALQEGSILSLTRPSCSRQNYDEEETRAQNSQSWVDLLEEEEAGVISGSGAINMPEDFSEIIPTPQKTIEVYEHEATTSALRLKSKNLNKNPAAKLADTIENAFGVIHKHLEQPEPQTEGDVSFGQTVGNGIKKIRSAKKRYLLKAKILQLIAENISDDEL